MKMAKIEKDVELMTPQERTKLVRKLEQQVEDIKSPIRYAVFSDIGGLGKYRLWLNVSDDCYTAEIEHATLFKRDRIALVVAKACSGTASKLRLFVAKITTKNDKIRVVKYKY